MGLLLLNFNLLLFILQNYILFGITLTTCTAIILTRSDTISAKIMSDLYPYTWHNEYQNQNLVF